MALALAGLLVAVVIPSAPPPTGRTTTVLVEPGDTLWEVAVAATPDGGDPRVSLARIRDLNGLDASTVAAWTTVVVPAP
jgi:hypothetical protein